MLLKHTYTINSKHYLTMNFVDFYVAYLKEKEEKTKDIIYRFMLSNLDKEGRRLFSKTIKEKIKEMKSNELHDTLDNIPREFKVEYEISCYLK